MIPAASATAPNDISTLIARSGVTLGKRLEPLGLLRGKLALLYQPGDVENDLDGWPSFPRVCPNILPSVRATS
jgi:hypothetical protein